MKSTPVFGSCLCGSIAYEVTHIENATAHCHCTMCRKFHGAAFATFGEAKRSNFRWLAGEELLKNYTASNGAVRKFCAQCGSSLIFESAGCARDVIEFSLGTLDSVSHAKPDAHIFTDYKADWVEIADNLPRYKEGR